MKTLEKFYPLHILSAESRLVHCTTYLSLFSFSHSFQFIYFLHTVQDLFWGAQFPLLQKHTRPSSGLFYQPSHASQSRINHSSLSDLIPSLGVISIPFRSRGFILYSIPGVGSLKNSARPTRDSEVEGSERWERSQPPVCLSILYEACMHFGKSSPSRNNVPLNIQPLYSFTCIYITTKLHFRDEASFFLHPNHICISEAEKFTGDTNINYEWKGT